MDKDMQGKVEFVALKKEEVEAMIARAALAGASLATETLEKAHKKEQQEQKDRRLHNTRLLLKNYRMLKESCAQAIYDREHEKSAAAEMEEIMMMKDEKAIVASIKRTSERTALIIAHIDKMLEIYRVYCGRNTGREKRQYKIIKDLYISKQKLTVQEISKKYGVSKVTVYEDIKIAEERLSALFFGINGLNFF